MSALINFPLLLCSRDFGETVTKTTHLKKNGNIFEGCHRAIVVGPKDREEGGEEGPMFASADGSTRGPCRERIGRVERRPISWHTQFIHDTSAIALLKEISILLYFCLY